MMHVQGWEALRTVRDGKESDIHPTWDGNETEKEGSSIICGRHALAVAWLDGGKQGFARDFLFILAYSG